MPYQSIQFKYADYTHLGVIEWHKAYAEHDFVYVDKESFEKYKPTSFRQLLEGFKEYKGVPHANATGGTR